MNEFHYYFLIQDIIGILLAALGFKLTIIYSIILIKHGFIVKNIFCLIGNVLLVFSGVNLVISTFNLQTWLVSLALFITAWIFGRLVYTKISHN